VWLEKFYHRRPHSSLGGKSPLEAWQAGIGEMRIGTPEAITEVFLHSAERKVDHTGCISFQGRLYSIGVESADRKVLLRYNPPSDLSRTDAFHKGERVAEAKPIKVAVQSRSREPARAPETEKVSFDELMARQQRRRFQRRLGAIPFSNLEGERDV
jgi:putative transposase